MMSPLLSSPISVCLLFGAIALPKSNAARLVRGRAMRDSDEEAPTAAPAVITAPAPRPKPKPGATATAPDLVLAELKSGPATLDDLVAALADRAKRSAISMALLRMERAGLIRVVSTIPSRGGRPAALFDLSEASPHA